MLQPPHDHPIQDILGHLELRVVLEVLHVEHRPDNVGVESALFHQPINVLHGVGIDMLQGSGKFVVEPLHEGDDAAGNPKHLPWCRHRLFLVVLPLLGILENDHFGVCAEKLEQLSKLLFCPAFELDALESRGLKGSSAPLTVSIVPGSCTRRNPTSGRSASKPRLVAPGCSDTASTPPRRVSPSP